MKVGRNFYGAVLDFFMAQYSWIHFLRSSMQKGGTILFMEKYAQID